MPSHRKHRALPYGANEFIPGTPFRILPRPLATPGEAPGPSILGQGAMGVVYEVQHASTLRFAAAKILFEHVARERGYSREQLDKEVHLMVRLRELTDLVPEVLDSGITTCKGAYAYVVMERLNGKSLRHHLQRAIDRADPRPIPIAQICGIGSDLAMALAPAHEWGVFHHDMKPENAFVHKRPDGTTMVKVLDFGLVGHVSDVVDGRFRGTLRYAAPEQYPTPEELERRGWRGPGPHSDIYSIGVILYEMTMGRLPHGDHDTPATREQIQRIVCEVTAPLISRSDVPEPSFASSRAAFQLTPPTGPRMDSNSPLCWPR